MFSPTPRATPRKSVYRQPGSVTRPGSIGIGGTPGGFLERGRERDMASATPSRAPASRIAALRGASPTRSIGGDSMRTIGAASARYESSELHDRVFLGRDERMGLLSLGTLPREVQDIVRRADPSSNQISGHVDIHSGYAFITTPDSCLAWNFAKRTQASPTIYAFPAPDPLETFIGYPAVFASLHHSGSAEPGLILVSSDGQIHLWEALGAALANVDRYQFALAQLEANEQVDRIWTIDPSTYLITTDQSRAFRLTITSSGGRQTPTVTPLVRSAGMFSRASPVLFSSDEDRKGITSVAVHGKEAWVLAGRTAQRWTFADNARLVQEQDLHDLIGKEAFADEWSSGEVDLEICDMAYAGSNRFAVVVSHVNAVSTSAASRSYALITLNTAARSGLLVVEDSLAIGFRPRFTERSRVQVHDMTAFIQFSDVVVTVDTSPASKYEDIIALRPLQENRPNWFIGSSVSTRRPTSASRGAAVSGVSMVFMPAAGGLVGVDLYTPPIMLERKTDEQRATARLKSKMEQAVFYGNRRDNPLTFDIVGDEDADVAAAAEQVSREILASSSAYAPGIYEVRPLLTDRLERLKQIMVYINQNNLRERAMSRVQSRRSAYEQLSQTARRRLSADAEKAKVAIDLWEHQDRLLSETGSETPNTLLADSISMLMRQYGANEGDDVVRQFFRTHVQYIDQLLSIVFNNYQEAMRHSPSTAERGAWVFEANRAFVITIRASVQYREATHLLYAVDRTNPTAELWTASNAVLPPMEILYDATVQLLNDRTRELGSTIDQGISPTDPPELRRQRFMQEELKDQLSDLAGGICTNMEDKLRTVSMHLTVGGDEQEGKELQRKWVALRPAVIRPLTEFDRVSKAYELAEHHRDFETLVWLCHSKLPRERNAESGNIRLEKYVHKWGEDFAFVLYQWYIDQKRAAALLNQDHIWHRHVTKFFAERGYPELAWVHHLQCKRFAEAGEALMDVQYFTGSQADRTIFDSIGKLAAVADLQMHGLSRERAQQIGEFDNELGLLKTQKRLRERIVASAPTTGPRRPANPVQQYIDSCTAQLEARPAPAFKRLFAQLAHTLYGGAVLDIEGLVDVLTLKDGRGEAGADAAEALDRLARDKSLASGRREVAVVSTWRRVFVQDDWAMIAQTAGRSDEAQRRLLKGTAVYALLDALERRVKELPAPFILTPLRSLSGPEPEELTARFPEMSPDEIDALMADHQHEIELLERYIDECNLEVRVKEVAAVLRATRGEGDVEARDGGDVDM